MFSLLIEDYGYGDGLEKAWVKNNIVERDRYCGGSVMILGGMLVCHSGKTELVIVIVRLNTCRYCDEIIIPVVIPVFQIGRADNMKQNKARCHVVCHRMFSPFTAEQHLDTRLASACE